MPELLKHQVARLLDQLTKVSSPSRRQITRCLEMMRPCLLSAEVTEADFDRFVQAVHAALTEGEVVMRLASAQDVRRTIERVLEQQLGVSAAEAGTDWLATRLSIDALTGGSPEAGRRWCLKEFENHTGKAPRRQPRARRADQFDRRLSSAEGLSPLNPFTMRTPDQAADRHARDLDREAVERLLRRMGMGGRDFGPEPPAGGTPARL